MSTDITIMPNVTVITQTKGHTDLERPTNRLKDRQVNGQKVRQTNGHRDRQANGERVRQTNGHG